MAAQTPETKEDWEEKKKSIGESIKKIFWVNSLSEDIIYDKTLQCHWFI